VNKNQHAIIYTGRKPPKPKSKELPKSRKEQGMRRPIRVRKFLATDKLDEMARINYAKIYSVEHNVKVYEFGVVHKDDEVHLIHDFYDVWGFVSGLPAPKLDVTEPTADGTSTAQVTEADDDIEDGSDGDEDEDDDDDDSDAASDETERASVSADAGEVQEEEQGRTSKGKGKQWS
jgi:hypothetical protein